MYVMTEPMLHIRLDPETRKWLKSLAGAAGMDMTEYVTALIQKDVSSLTPQERQAVEILQSRAGGKAPKAQAGRRKAA